MKTWRQFTKGKMGLYMKSEGSHGGAMARLSKEWKEYKAKNGVSKSVSKKKRKTRKVKKYKSRNLKTCSGAGATLVHKKSTRGLKSAAGRKLVKCKKK